MDKEPLRAWTIVDRRARQVPFEAAFAKRAVPAPVAYAPVDGATIDAAFTAALAARAQRLGVVGRALDALPPPTPEDGSRRIAAFHLSYGAMDHARERFIEQLAAVGRVEGFRVVVRTFPGGEDELRATVDRRDRGNVTVVSVDDPGDIWTEDAGELLGASFVAVPARLPEGMDATREILCRRARRFAGNAPADEPPAGLSQDDLFRWLAAHAPGAGFGVLGEVFARTSQKGMVALAAASGRAVRASSSAIEGGNLIVATTVDGRTAALVGRDSSDLTRAVLERELGRAVDDGELKALIQEDLGVDAVVLVEQPGDYHLDVRMTAIGPGVILLDDAEAAAQQVAQWSNETYAAEEPKPPRGASSTSPAARARYEQDHASWRARAGDLKKWNEWAAQGGARAAVGQARAVADLQAAGFVVHRAPLVFPGTLRTSPMNFVNCEQGRGKDGRRFYIALGGDRRGERALVETLRQLAPDVARVYFLDRTVTSSTLQAGGGVSCRVKAEAVPN